MRRSILRGEISKNPERKNMKDKKRQNKNSPGISELGHKVTGPRLSQNTQNHR